MSDVIFLDPASAIPQDVVTLTQVCKANLLQNLNCRIVDETLCPDKDNKIFSSQHKNWIGSPQPKIKKVNSNGIETALFESTDFTLSLNDGTVTFSTAVTDTVIASFTFFPFTDAQLTDLVKQSIVEVRVAIWRPIDPDKIAEDYIHTICKRLYTNVLKSLLLEAKDFFSVAVAGRQINKTNIVPQINTIIDQNEKQVQTEFYALRNFNRTRRIAATVQKGATITSNTNIVTAIVTQTITSDTVIT